VLCFCTTTSTMPPRNRSQAFTQPATLCTTTIPPRTRNQLSKQFKIVYECSDNACNYKGTLPHNKKCPGPDPKNRRGCGKKLFAKCTKCSAVLASSSIAGHYGRFHIDATSSSQGNGDAHNIAASSPQGNVDAQNIDASSHQGTDGVQPTDYNSTRNNIIGGSIQSNFTGFAPVYTEEAPLTVRYPVLLSEAPALSFFGTEVASFDVFSPELSEGVKLGDYSALGEGAALANQVLDEGLKLPDYESAFLGEEAPINILNLFPESNDAALLGISPVVPDGAQQISIKDLERKQRYLSTESLTRAKARIADLIQQARRTQKTTVLVAREIITTALEQDCAELKENLCSVGVEQEKDADTVRQQQANYGQVLILEAKTNGNVQTFAPGKYTLWVSAPNNKTMLCWVCCWYDNTTDFSQLKKLKMKAMDRGSTTACNIYYTGGTMTLLTVKIVSSEFIVEHITINQQDGTTTGSKKANSAAQALISSRSLSDELCFMFRKLFS